MCHHSARGAICERTKRVASNLKQHERRTSRERLTVEFTDKKNSYKILRTICTKQPREFSEISPHCNCCKENTVVAVSQRKSLLFQHLNILQCSTHQDEDNRQRNEKKRQKLIELQAKKSKSLSVVDNKSKIYVSADEITNFSPLFYLI